jgi:excisionase family DNA binding protein
MVSSIVIAAEGFEPEEKRWLIDEIAADSQQERDHDKPTRKHGRLRTGASLHDPSDDLEARIGPKLIFSINELAALADKSPATIFRLLRLGQLPFVQVGGSRCFTRAAVLNFLRRGTQAVA